MISTKSSKRQRIVADHRVECRHCRGPRTFTYNGRTERWTFVCPRCLSWFWTPSFRGIVDELLEAAVRYRELGLKLVKVGQTTPTGRLVVRDLPRREET